MSFGSYSSVLNVFTVRHSINFQIRSSVKINIYCMKGKCNLEEVGEKEIKLLFVMENATALCKPKWLKLQHQVQIKP